jgi:hypothetical protein
MEASQRQRDEHIIMNAGAKNWTNGMDMLSADSRPADRAILGGESGD